MPKLSAAAIAAVAAASSAAAQGRGSGQGIAAAERAPGLTLFEFTAASKPWRVVNDVVMGGRSNSTMVVTGGVGVFAGEVVDVPALQAPGVCQATATIDPVDASSYNAIELTLASKGPLHTFKTAFSGKYVPLPNCTRDDGVTPAPCPFYVKPMYKAGFKVTGSGGMEGIVVPLTEYTSNPSKFTGGCTDHGATCCSPEHPDVCPFKKALSSISEVAIWAQGTDGKFELDIKSIRAIKQAV